MATEKAKVCIFDIDGVLNYYPACWVDFANRMLGENFKDLNEMKNTLSYSKYKMAKDKYRTSRIKKLLEVRRGAREVLKELKDKGYYIIMVTARPLDKYPDLMMQTTEWLKMNGLLYDNLFFSEKKHLAILKYFPHIDFVVEDNRKNASDMSACCERVFLVSNEYNDGEVPENVTRIEHLKELLKDA